MWRLFEIRGALGLGVAGKSGRVQMLKHPDGPSAWLQMYTIAVYLSKIENGKSNLHSVTLCPLRRLSLIPVHLRRSSEKRSTTTSVLEEIGCSGSNIVMSPKPHPT